MAKKVIVYSTSTCHYCVRVKEFLKTNNIEFETVDVGADQAAAHEMINKSGQMGVPVLDIGGKIIVGFDKDAIQKELDI